MTQAVEIPSQWVPIALSKMIESGTSAGVVAKGAEIVVWRDSRGIAHAWDDRCPHRGMKMSFGFVRGDRITCLYHGWQYDESGTCQYIPAHPDVEVPKSICVTRYGVAEAGGMIWAQLPLGAPTVPFSGLPVMEAVKSLYVDASEVLVLMALQKLGAVDGAVAHIVVLEQEDLTMTIGVQPISDTQCALHITVPEASTSAAKEAVLDWSEEMRRTIEALEVTA